MKIANIGGARAAIVTYKGQEHYFLYNGLAMFALQERFGEENFLTAISESSKKGLEDLLYVAAILAENGELARREMGFDPAAIVTSKDLGTAVRMQPRDMVVLREGCADAVAIGYAQDISDDDEEIDLGLQELQKKRK